MIATLLFAFVLMMVLALLMARFSAPILRRASGDSRPAMPLASLRVLVAELLRAMGLTLVDDSPDENYLVATRREAFGDSRYVAVIAPGDVDQADVLAAAETVKGEGAGNGMLVTSGEIHTAGLGGLEVTINLVDGPRFRQLIAQHLPARLPLVDRYRGFGPTAEAVTATRRGRQPSAT